MSYVALHCKYTYFALEFIICQPASKSGLLCLVEMQLTNHFFLFSYFLFVDGIVKPSSKGAAKAQPSTLAPWNYGKQPGPVLKEKKDRESTALWDKPTVDPSILAKANAGMNLRVYIYRGGLSLYTSISLYLYISISLYWWCLISFSLVGRCIRQLLCSSIIIYICNINCIALDQYTNIYYLINI